MNQRNSDHGRTLYQLNHSSADFAVQQFKEGSEETRGQGTGANQGSGSKGDACRLLFWTQNTKVKGRDDRDIDRVDSLILGPDFRLIGGQNK